MPSRLRTFVGTTLFVLALAAPAAAQEVSYKPPVVGTTVTYNQSYVSKVTAVDGDVTTVEVSGQGPVQEVKFYKGITSLQVGLVTLTIDTAAADKLWPLALGNTTAIAINGADPGSEAILQGTQTVTVVGFEELDLGFTTLETVVLDITTEMTLAGMMNQQGQPLQPQVIHFANKLWYASDLGVDVKSDLTMTFNGQTQPPISTTATAITVP